MVSHITQTINPFVTQAIDGFKDSEHSVYPAGSTIYHEMSENHIAGKRYLENYDKYMEELNKAKGESERFKVIERQVKELWEYSHPKAFSQPSFKGWSTEKNGERFYHIKSFIKEGSLYDSKETQFRYW
ncbi:MAG: hypothetical protein IKP81_04015 [Paludibacteraceae bacterium]|nr:hypothetical protein [Paludibacteraceae bacterium]